MLRLYNTALLPLRLAVELWAAWQSRNPTRRVEWAERRARRLPAVAPRGAWIHGASVGEARIVSGLARAVRAQRPALPLVVSAYTTTGRVMLPDPPQIDAAFYVPLDFPALPRRMLDAVRPAVLALVETELWPNLLHEAHSAGVQVLVLNGRLSEKRMARYRRLSALYRPLLAGLSRLGVQTPEDAARFVELGAPQRAVVVTGNVKYDQPLPEIDAAALRERLGLGEERPVFVAGSTGPGEETPVVEAFQRVRAACPDLLLILAPRYPSRTNEVDDLLRKRRLRAGRFSESAGRGGQLDVLLVDTLGQLAALYQLAAVAFVGGSLIPVGGHNLLEPAAVGAPVLFGPYTENAAASADALLESGGGLRVADGSELARALQQLLQDGSRRAEMARCAHRVVQANRGALERSVSLLLSAIDGQSTVGVA